MVQLQFEDPPARRPTDGSEAFNIYKNVDRDAIIEALIRHPGRWAVVSRHASRARANKVAAVLRGRHPGHRFRASTTADREGVVYGRYGDPDVNMVP